MKGAFTVHHGNNVTVLKELIDAGVLVDAVVTDPPYGLKFMNRHWDYDVPMIEFWRLVYELLKPGGHVLSFGGTRTYHRMVLNLEDAGFEIRDQLCWLYGSGFPKSLDVSKAIDKSAGVERIVTGIKPGHEEFADGTTRGHIDSKGSTDGFDRPSMHDDEARARYHLQTAATTEGAQQWSGWGTALKPAVEPIVLARKPLSEATVAANVLKWGTGALNVDGCRIETGGVKYDAPGDRGQDCKNRQLGFANSAGKAHNLGRWPANILLDEEAGTMLDEQSGALKGPWGKESIGKNRTAIFGSGESNSLGKLYHDSGGASRFFYCAKASKRERNGSKHPTIKPLALIRYLCRLITPPGGIVIDPFAGSGTTGEAAILEGFVPILIEREEDYIKDINLRLARCDRPEEKANLTSLFDDDDNDAEC